MAVVATLLLFVSSVGADELAVTAVANEGFLVQANGKSVLVDALFRATAPYPEFFQQGPTNELIERMIDGEGDFDRVDLVLVTHHHADHHDAKTAVEFLRRHPETRLVGSEAVRVSMEEQVGYEEVAPRVVAPALRWGECVDLELNAIGVRVCRVPHSGAADLSNLIYRVDLGGTTFAHEGDAELAASTFEGKQLDEGGLDLAFVHSFWVSSWEGREAVRRWLRPRSIVLMHHRWSKAEDAQRLVSGLAPADLESLPPVVVFSAEGERRNFTFDK